MADNGSYSDKSQPITDNNIPDNLKPNDVINNDVMHSVGLYSQSEIEEARFSKYSRFGRVLDQYGKLNDCREYLFFVKPDLHIAVPVSEIANGSAAYNIKEEAKNKWILSKLVSSRRANTVESNSIYKLGYSTSKLSFDPTQQHQGLIINPQLYDNSYFR